ncbi:MAG TPA: c-type cytochrome [Casimicrobiaceae bacterium]|nr:c-type cytochrome [Casimicrobiaceae bacterium]
MSRWVDCASLAILATVACATISGALAAPKYGFGLPATAAEIAGWDIDVRPDGTGLPDGRGSVAEGQKIYDAKCASCHGTFGESNSYLQIAGGVGSLHSDQPVRTTGSKLNYATTLWDYINRAMPFEAPKTLAPDEVYALTAYVLNLNDILPADAVLDRNSLPLLKMPNRDGFTIDHGFMRRDGKPDTRNVACMRNCVAEVRVTSEMPDYALGQHGNVAEQARGLPVAPAPAAPKSGLESARAAACTACHGVTEKVVGPSFREIAGRYAGDGAAEATLVAKVRAGGGGNWGNVPMPPQTQLPDADVRSLVQWILAGAR